MALTPNPCLTAILCGLSTPAVNALNAILDQQKAVLTAQLAQISASLTVISILAVPVQATQDLVNEALDAARSAANIIPVSLIAGCAPLGKLTTDINDSLDSATAAANNLLNDLNRKLAFKAELEDAQTAIQTLIDDFNQIQVALAGCP